jgi:hypothetical protein
MILSVFQKRVPLVEYRSLKDGPPEDLYSLKAIFGDREADELNILTCLFGLVNIFLCSPSLRIDSVCPPTSPSGLPESPSSGAAALVLRAAVGGSIATGLRLHLRLHCITTFSSRSSRGSCSSLLDRASLPFFCQECCHCHFSSRVLPLCSFWIETLFGLIWNQTGELCCPRLGLAQGPRLVSVGLAQLRSAQLRQARLGFTCPVVT